MIPPCAALPALLGVCTIPLAYLCGGRLRSGGEAFDREGAVITMLVVATSPWAIRYSTENRMYSLAILLVLLGILAFLHAMRSPTPGPLTAVALATAALLYTTYWAFFLLAVVGAVLIVWCLRAQPPARGTVIRLILTVLAGCLLFVPWLPILVTQLRHTGTPWSVGPNPIAFVTTITQFGGANYWAGRVLTVLLGATAIVAVTGWAIPKVSRRATPAATGRVRVAFHDRRRDADSRYRPGDAVEHRVPSSVRRGGVPVRRAGCRIRAPAAAGSCRRRVGDRPVRARRGSALDHDGTHRVRAVWHRRSTPRHAPGMSSCTAPIRSGPRPPVSFADRSRCAS